MSPKAKMEYLEQIHPRYKEANRKEKIAILDEFCENCGYHRKHAIRRLNTFKRFTKPILKTRGRPSIYNKPSVLKPIKAIWLTANLPCSKILKPVLSVWLKYYTQEYGAPSLDVIKAVNKISPATIDRVLKPVRTKYKTRGRSTTKPGTLLRKQIPIKTEQWNEARPGFLESDTVAHCGDTTEGIYANTVNFVDIATGWTEQRAVWGKGERGVVEQVKDVENTLPFPLLGFDCDNGGEFINHHLIRHFGDRINPIQFTRSRPYHKDDNCHVEQKNWTHIRQWLGYHRFDNPKAVPLINEMYKSGWRLYFNFFVPSFKLIEKKRVASKTIKCYDKPKTPYQRVLESREIPNSVKRSLKEQYDQLNPFRLREAIDKKLEKIFDTIRNRKSR